MISSVAYAVEETASDAKIGSATRLRQLLVVLLRGRDRLADQHPLGDGHHTQRHSRSGVPCRVRAYAPTGARGGRRMRARGLGAQPGPARPRAHRGDHRPPARGVRPAGRGLRRPDRRGHRVRPRPADRGGHRAGERGGGGDERRQLQRARRPGRPRELRHRAGRGPHLRPSPGDDLPTPRAPDRGHGRVDDRPRAPPPAPEQHPGRVDRPDGEAVSGRTGAPRRLGGSAADGSGGGGRGAGRRRRPAGVGARAERRHGRPTGRPAVHRGQDRRGRRARQGSGRRPGPRH